MRSNGIAFILYPNDDVRWYCLILNVIDDDICKIGILTTNINVTELVVLEINLQEEAVRRD